MRRFPFIILLLLGSVTASAQSYLSPNPSPNSIEDRFRLEFGVFYGSYSTDIRLDDVTLNSDGTIASVTPGTPVSGEDDFGLAETQVLGQVELTLLPGKHHMVRLNGLSMRREGSSVLTHNIRWDESTFRVNERVDSHLNLTMVGLTYGYLPIRRDHFELGVSFGIQIASFSANAEVRSRSIRDEESAVGPVPLLGLEGRYDFTPHWSIDGRIQYLSLAFIESAGVDLSGVDGTITDFRIAVRYRQNQHFLYGLGYRRFNVDAESSNDDPSGIVDMGLSGPVLFVQASL